MNYVRIKLFSGLCFQHQVKRRGQVQTPGILRTIGDILLYPSNRRDDDSYPVNLVFAGEFF